MTFTDDDLKRLKELDNRALSDMGANLFIRDHLQALLARLEAAEKVCRELDGSMRQGLIESDALAKWRKAAGK